LRLPLANKKRTLTITPVGVEKVFLGPKCHQMRPDWMTGNVSEIEKAVYRASWRDLIFGARAKKEFFNSYACYRQ
jgi:hypothetical protein